MAWAALGGLGLVALLLLARAFAAASPRAAKAMLLAAAAVPVLGLALAAVLSGRGAGLAWALPVLGPLAWRRWRARGTLRAADASAVVPIADRAEALAVLGLTEGAADAEVRAAHRRLLAAVHPDRGGSAWLAARLNAARDALLDRPG